MRTVFRPFLELRSAGDRSLVGRYGRQGMASGGMELTAAAL
ncbi:hypothetical protein ACFSQ7_33740 [Paenibacillus rhizoplanae]